MGDEVVQGEGIDPGRVLLTPSVLRGAPGREVFYGLLVQLRHGPDDLARFTHDARALVPNKELYFQTATTQRQNMNKATRPETVALVAFALLAGLCR